MARKARKAVIRGKILSNEKIAADHFLLKLEAPFLGARSVPGQFVNVKAAEETTDPLLRVPLGIHAIRGSGIHLLYKVVGPGTKILSGREKGGALDVLGPLGKGFSLPDSSGGKAVFVAGGHGVAPLYALAEAVSKRKGTIDFFIGARIGDHIVCADKIRKLGAKVHIATEDGKKGRKGYVTGLLKEYLGRSKKRAMPDVIYGCGPSSMLKVCAGEAEARGIPAQVSLDAYMACGTGACLGCAVRTIDGYKLVCRDGPVFAAQKVDWE